MNIYKNGYLYHFIVGYAIFETFNNYGVKWGLIATAICSVGKEIYDFFKKKKLEMKDILCTLAGGIIALCVEYLKNPDITM